VKAWAKQKMGYGQHAILFLSLSVIRFNVADLESTEMIREEPLISPDYPRYKTIMLDGGGNLIGYALECEDNDMDVMVFSRFYEGSMRHYIDEKVEEILEKSRCVTRRFMLLNENCGTERILFNYTGNVFLLDGTHK
jgi:hypothetical protein